MFLGGVEYQHFYHFRKGKILKFLRFLESSAIIEEKKKKKKKIKKNMRKLINFLLAIKKKDDFWSSFLNIFHKKKL